MPNETTCETLAHLLEEAGDNEALANAIQAAIEAAGCGVIAQSGGTGRPKLP